VDATSSWPASSRPSSPAFGLAPASSRPASRPSWPASSPTRLAAFFIVFFTASGRRLLGHLLRMTFLAGFAAAFTALGAAFLAAFFALLLLHRLHGRLGPSSRPRRPSSPAATAFFGGRAPPWLAAARQPALPGLAHRLPGAASGWRSRPSRRCSAHAASRPACGRADAGGGGVAEDDRSPPPPRAFRRWGRRRCPSFLVIIGLVRRVPERVGVVLVDGPAAVLVLLVVVGGELLPPPPPNPVSESSSSRSENSLSKRSPPRGIVSSCLVNRYVQPAEYTGRPPAVKRGSPGAVRQSPGRRPGWPLAGPGFRPPRPPDASEPAGPHRRASV
jgi:hypothetical protein